MRYENLEVWKRSRRLAIEIYRCTDRLGNRSFKDQITRAALSIPSNIAEGLERESNKEKARFLTIAKGSTGELKTQIDIGIEIRYLDQSLSYLMDEAEEISKMLGGFIKTLATRH